METLPIETKTKLENQARLIWHKPEIQHLSIRLDTADNPGSGADGPTFGTLPSP
jgi:hypothetical protein